MALWGLINLSEAGPLLWLAVAVAIAFLIVLLRVFCKGWKPVFGRQDWTVPHEAKLELFTGGLDTNPERIRCCLAEKGLEFTERFVDPGCFGRFENLREENLRRNPNASNPFLVVEGHPVLGIEAMVTFIEKHFGKKLLFGEREEDFNQVVKWAMLTDMNVNGRNDPEIGSYCLGSAVRILSQPVIVTLLNRRVSYWRCILALLRSPAPMNVRNDLSRSWGWQGTAPQAFAASHKSLKKLEDILLDGREYLLGNRFTYADICVAATLNRLEQLGLWEPLLVVKSEQDFTKLREYWARLKARDSFEPSFRRKAEHRGARDLEEAFSSFSASVARLGPAGAYRKFDDLDQEEEEED